MRVLVLGATGVNKEELCRNLKAEGALQDKSVEVFHFEKDFLTKRPGVRSFASYLSKNVYEQADAWYDAWPSLEAELNKSRSADVTICCLHGTLVRHFYGVRIAIDIQVICDDFKPDLVITLLDDVFNMWWRTEERAGGDNHKGRPSLEQLLMARRAEGLVGDAIVGRMFAKKETLTRHIALSVNHPISTLANIVFNGASIAYLSFPISRPRKFLQKGDSTLANAMSEFHRRALQFQKSNKRIAFISPLAIDELPFAIAAQKFKEAIEAKKAKEEHFQFDRDNLRWSFDELWPGEKLLVQPPEPEKIPWKQADEVRGLIATDVGWRDNRLVLQSNVLTVYSPSVPRLEKDGGGSEIARGVREEIERASHNFTQSMVFQNTKFDPSGKWSEYYGSVGSMGLGPGHEFISNTDSFDTMFEKASQVGD